MLRRLGIILLQVAFVVGVTVLAWFNVAVSIIAICAVILVVVSGKFGSLVEFSFGPLKAKVERNLSESEQLLENLKALSVQQARAVNAASVSTGRFASGDDWVFQSVKRIENSLKILGVTDEELSDARQDFVRLTISDAAAAALGGPRVPMYLGKVAVAEWQDRVSTDRSDPDTVEAYLKKWDALDEERAIRIEDMRWMIEHADVRDREQYMRAHTAVDWPNS